MPLSYFCLNENSIICLVLYSLQSVLTYILYLSLWDFYRWCKSFRGWGACPTPLVLAVEMEHIPRSSDCKVLSTISHHMPISFGFTCARIIHNFIFLLRSYCTIVWLKWALTIEHLAQHLPHLARVLSSNMYPKITCIWSASRAHAHMCMCVCVHACVLLCCVWLFAIPWTVAHKVHLSMGFPRSEYWSGLPFPSPGESSQPRDPVCVSYIFCTGRQVLYH